MNKLYTLVDLEDERRRGRKWLMGPFLPESSTLHTKAIEIGYVRLQGVESTDVLHYHSESDEYYVVLRGHMQIQIDSEVISVSAGQVLLVRSKAEHLILQVEPDTRILLVKAPPSQGDKVIVSDSA